MINFFTGKIGKTGIILFSVLSSVISVAQEKSEFYKASLNGKEDIIMVKEDTVIILLQRGHICIYGGKTDGNYIESFNLKDNRVHIKTIKDNPENNSKLVVENVFWKSPTLKDSLTTLLNPQIIFYDERNNLRFIEKINEDKFINDKIIFTIPIKFGGDLNDIDFYKINNDKGKNNKIERITLPDTIYYDYAEFRFGDERISINNIIIKPHQIIVADLYFYPPYPLRYLKSDIIYFEKRNNYILLDYPIEFIYYKTMPVIFIDEKYISKNNRKITFTKMEKEKLTLEYEELFSFLLNKIREM